MRHRRLPTVTAFRVLALITALVFLLPATGLAVQGRTAGGSAPRTADATGSRPKPTATGHLHLLAAPARVADSRSGKGLPKRPFAADSGLALKVAGVGGLPRSGILAVAVVVTTSAPAGPTSIRMGPPSSTPVLVTDSGTTSAFAIVPVSAGAIQLGNGAHPTQLAVDVVGWFSAVKETGNGGLFRSLAGRAVTTVTVAAGSTRTVNVLGAGGIPRGHVSGVLVRLVTTASRAGTLAIGPTAKGTSGRVSQAYRSGSTSDPGLTRVGSTGSFVIRNAGKGSLRVSIDALGWFTDGRDSDAFGDALSLGTPFGALTTQRIGTDGTPSTVCGTSGIPAATISRPPSLVLARGLATAASETASLLADAVGTTPTGAPALALDTTNPRAGLLLLTPGGTCRNRFSTSSGQATLTVEPYAWFGGGTIISSHVRLLTGPALAAVTGVTATTVTFTGPAASLPSIKVGDILTAGVSDATPAGLLRAVTAVAPGTNRLVVTTRDAGLGEAVLQGSLSVGQRTQTPALAALKRPRLKQGPRLKHGPKPSGTGASCHSDGAPSGFGFSVSCSDMFSGPGWSATVSGSASASMTFDVGISWGFPPSVHVRTSAGVSTAARADASASVDASVDVSMDWVSEKLWNEEVTIPIGEVPVVIVPQLYTTIGVSGSLAAGFQASAQVRGDASVTYDSDTGLQTHRSHDGEGTASTSGEASIKGSLQLGVRALLYGGAEFYLSVGAGPNLKVKADACTLSGHVGVELSIGYSIGITKHISVSKDLTIASVDKTVFTEPWRACAVWSGTMTARQNDHSIDDLGRPVGDENWSESVTLSAPPDGLPPSDSSYAATGSGSGAMHVISYGCEKDGVFDPARWTYTWGGDVTGAGSSRFTISPSAAPGYMVIWDTWHGSIDGTVTRSGCFSDPTSSSYQQDSRFFMLPDPAVDTGCCDIMAFAAPAGQVDFGGTRVIDIPQPNGGMVHQQFTYALHKTCLGGGTDC